MGRSKITKWWLFVGFIPVLLSVDRVTGLVFLSHSNYECWVTFLKLNVLVVGWPIRMFLTCICSSYNSGLVSQKVRINFNGPGKCHWSGHWGLLVKPDGFLDWKSMYISLRRVDHWPILFEPKPFKAGFLFEFLFQRIHLHAELHGYHIDPSNHFLVNYSNFREYSILAYVDYIAHSGYSNGSDKLFKVHGDQWNVGLYVYRCKDKVEGVLVM